MTKQKPTLSDTASGQKLKHPAFGVIEVSRPSSSPGATLFGSDLRHNHYIRVSISTASLSKHDTSDWIFPNQQVLSFNLSEAQWAKFVAGAGRSLATPITFERITTGSLESVPEIEPLEESRKQAFNREFHDKLKEALSEVKDLTNQLEQLAQGKSVSKVALRDVVKNLKIVSGNLPSNLAFAVERFKEVTENIAEEAKAEVEAYAMNVIISAGVKAQMPQMPQMTQVSEPPHLPPTSPNPQDPN